jgi:hypothetical protein
VLGTGTTALLVKSAWVRGLLYHGQHLTAPVVYGRELFASQSAGSYLLMCLAFPVIGALMGVFGAAAVDGLASPQPDGGRPPGPPSPPGSEPLLEVPGPSGVRDEYLPKQARPAGPVVQALRDQVPVRPDLPDLVVADR